ncbi:MAG: YIP1 family protein [Deinococcota bacterium]
MTLPEAIGLVGRSLRLDPSAFEVIQTSPRGLTVALVVVLLGTLSEAIGQSIMLFANRVRPRRFVLSLLLSSGIQAFGMVFWTASVWWVAGRVFGVDANLRQVTRAVGLGYSPYLFSFFILVPFFGAFINGLLSLWRLLVVVLAVDVALDLSVRQALLSSGLGWLLLQVVKSTIGRPVISLTRVMRRWVAGVELSNLNELFKALQGSPSQTVTKTSTKTVTTSPTTSPITTDGSQQPQSQALQSDTRQKDAMQPDTVQKDIPQKDKV